MTSSWCVRHTAGGVTSEVFSAMEIAPSLCERGRLPGRYAPRNDRQRDGIATAARLSARKSNFILCSWSPGVLISRGRRTVAPSHYRNRAVIGGYGETLQVRIAGDIGHTVVNTAARRCLGLRRLLFRQGWRSDGWHHSVRRILPWFCSPPGIRSGKA